MINLKLFKQSILQEAMQGKLTQQKASDGTADELLKQIQNKKTKLIKAGKIKRSKKLPPIKKSEIPFNIPRNWKWVRLGDILLIISGRDIPKRLQTKIRNKNDIPYITGAGNFNKSKITTNTYLHRSYASVISNKNDLLITVKGTIGKLAFQPYNKAHIARQIIAIRFISGIQPLLIKSLLQLTTIKLKASAHSMIPGIKKNTLQLLLFPLPPLLEQKRIVARVHKCFEFADEIQYQRNLKKKFADNMKQSLLMEAMQGKLTKQLQSDGNAEGLLQKIQQKKQALIKAGKIHQHKKLSPITKDKVPFKIPKNWKWVRLDDIGSWESGSTPKRSNKSYYIGNIPWLKVGDLNNGYINDAEEHISKGAFNKSSLRVNPKGSVLMAMYAGEDIGKLGILNIDATTNQAICDCIPYLINSKFLFYYLMSQRKGFMSIGTGGTQSNISRTKIIHYLFPLPPLKEQDRIVQTVSKLLNIL